MAAKSGFQVVRYKDGKSTFEIMCKNGTALKFREGDLKSVNDVLFSDEIFSDQSKGERAPEDQLRATFSTTNVSEVAKIILEKGDLQLSTAERKAKVDQKTKEIVNYIHKYYIDPKTKAPHPMTRIENALVQMKVNIDPWIGAEKQFHDKIERKLPEVIPVKKCEIAGTLKVPHAFAAQAQGTIKKWCGNAKEDWDENGLIMEVSVVPGDYDPFCAAMNDVTKGNYTFDVAGQSLNTLGSADESGAKGKYGKGKKAATAAKGKSRDK
eukprot:TRINITY_DN11997_c0_g1_i1.p1 TRINITY_DN11997_c0_g1~~TRINITY_DN11997_c0_g1_i1.p1  ORF type:complete len:290 (+),score=78.44 TRINITY_DN11997_c0_g1_i1:71-871(+)